MSLGLTEPDLVEDVLRNVIPKYCAATIVVSNEIYETDIGRMLAAFRTDSRSQNQRLTEALRNAKFVNSVDAGDGSQWWSKPGNVYIATQRLSELFAGVPKVYLVNDERSFLRGEDVRDLLEASGATRYLQPIPSSPRFTYEEKIEMRTQAGSTRSSGSEQIEDVTLRGLDQLLRLLPNLNPKDAQQKASALWSALCDMVQRRGVGAFSGTYTWFFHTSHKCAFDAAFVLKLNGSEWIPDGNGGLQKPDLVLFDRLGWEPNPFLLSKIHFKPPIIETLAKEAGIDPAVLDLLKKLGLTELAELKTKLGYEDDPESGDGKATVNAPEGGSSDFGGLEGSGDGAGEGGPIYGEATAPHRSGGSYRGNSGSHGGREIHGNGGWQGGHKRTPGGAGGRPFISYLGASPDDDKDPDPDNLDREKRLLLEEKAISLILTLETALERTELNNPGFDLFERGRDGNPIRWVEVKAMTGDLYSRPVGISHTQFEFAQEQGKNYWLYIVEHADSPEDAHVVKIQDPAGKAQTFTFDYGWLSVAVSDDENQ